MKRKCARIASFSLLGLLAHPLVSVARPIPAPDQGSQPIPQAEPMRLEDGTPAKLRLSRTISSATAQTDDRVDFDVLEEVRVGGILVIPKGSVAWGTVTDAQAKRRMARGGKLDINIDAVRLADGQKAALRGVKDVKGGGHTGAMTGAIVATSLVVWPAAPFFLFMHGKDITLPQGTELTVYVNGDLPIDPGKFGKTTAPGERAAQPLLAGQPTVTLVEPSMSSGSETLDVAISPITIRGVAMDVAGIPAVTINGIPAAMRPKGPQAAEFVSDPIQLQPGQNRFEIVATNAAHTEAKITFVARFTPPNEPSTRPVVPPTTTNPLAKPDIISLLKAGVPSARVAELVSERGIKFPPNDDDLIEIRAAGGSDELVGALRQVPVRALGEASGVATGELTVTTSPNAKVYLDGELKGRANEQGEMAVELMLGTHALKISLAGKEDFQQSVTLTGREGVKIEARLRDLDPPPGEARANPSDGLKYVWIPSGTFRMGCSWQDNECFAYEKPAHQVTITKGFWIGQTEVTVGAYKRFAAVRGGRMPAAPPFNSGWANDNMPIVNVTWDDANDYCRWAGGRLPREAEWEYAARGGSMEARYGNLDEVAWSSENSGKQTHEVAQKRANAFGLFDVLGNAGEWVSDWYDYYQNSPSQDPAGPASGLFRVLRGGSWFLDPRGARVSSRNWNLPTYENSSVGFRCVEEVTRP